MSDMSADDVKVYYNRGREQGRLTSGNNQLELLRSQEIISRYLPQSPAAILDIGGGAGVYALWLARLGYKVHLVDLMPIHIEQAMTAAQSQPDHPLASATVDDARKLDFPDDSFDSVLMLGPLYHLTERAERIEALREAYRVLKPSGYLFAATISRFASMLDGLMQGYLADEYFAGLVERVLVDSQHRNPKGEAGYFATAYFHYPTDSTDELAEAGFQVEAAVAIEGMAGFMPNFDQFWDDETLRERLLKFLRATESEPTMLGATGHIMTVGRKA
jgi:ubiquinone/menaquinone biosynthesis C-methylase UbiE